MAKLKEIIYLSNEQYDELSSNGSITIDGITLNFDPDSYLYLTPEEDKVYVRFDINTQGLTDTQKANARANIGAGTSNFSGSYNDLSNKPSIPSKDSDLTNDRYVRYDTNAQGLNDTQKANARANIGAGTGAGSVTSVQVQASDCITSTQSTAQTSTLNTTIKHNEILGTAKTTKSLYLMKIDKYGHITEADAVSIYGGAASGAFTPYDGSIS